MMRAIALFSAALALLGCSTQDEAHTCTNVPSGGCPLLNGTACDDPSCVAAYACTPNGWVFDHACPAHDGGTMDGATMPTDAGARDVDVDVPGASGGPGCDPLQPPDCTLAFAASCPTSDCCGCEDVFVCQDGGWNTWGVCADGGLSPR